MENRVLIATTTRNIEALARGTCESLRAISHGIPQHNIMSATDPSILRTFSTAFKYDHINVDSEHPINGLEFATEVRASKGLNYQTPIIITTGNKQTLDEEIERLTLPGITVLSKPYTKGILQSALRKIYLTLD